MLLPANSHNNLIEISNWKTEMAVNYYKDPGAFMNVFDAETSHLRNILFHSGTLHKVYKWKVW